MTLFVFILGFISGIVTLGVYSVLTLAPEDEELIKKLSENRVKRRRPGSFF